MFESLKQTARNSVRGNNNSKDNSEYNGLFQRNGGGKNIMNEAVRNINNNHKGNNDYEGTSNHDNLFQRKNDGIGFFDKVSENINDKRDHLSKAMTPSQLDDEIKKMKSSRLNRAISEVNDDIVINDGVSSFDDEHVVRSIKNRKRGNKKKGKNPFKEKKNFKNLDKELQQVYDKLSKNEFDESLIKILNSKNKIRHIKNLALKDNTGHGKEIFDDLVARGIYSEAIESNQLDNVFSCVEEVNKKYIRAIAADLDMEENNVHVVVMASIFPQTTNNKELIEKLLRSDTLIKYVTDNMCDVNLENLARAIKELSGEDLPIVVSRGLNIQRSENVDVTCFNDMSDLLVTMLEDFMTKKYRLITLKTYQDLVKKNGNKRIDFSLIDYNDFPKLKETITQNMNMFDDRAFVK